MAAATEMAPARAGSRKRSRSGPDRLTVAMLTVSAFLLVLGLLATQLRVASAAPGHRVVLVRRIYQTRVVETVIAQSAVAGGSSVTQSVSSSGATAIPAPAPATRSSR